MGEAKKDCSNRRGGSFNGQVEVSLGFAESSCLFVVGVERVRIVKDCGWVRTKISNSESDNP